MVIQSIIFILLCRQSFQKRIRYISFFSFQNGFFPIPKQVNRLAKQWRWFVRFVIGVDQMMPDLYGIIQEMKSGRCSDQICN